MSNLNFFLPISKVDKKERMVWGYASTPSLDLDGEIVSTDAIKAALPGYMEWRNIREMHQASAVGTAKEATVDDKGLYLGAKIVDEDAWQKVLEEVYKGFSIGGKKIAKTGNTITELELIEISLVDRPANPDCKIEVIKAAKADVPEFLLNKVSLEREDIGLIGRLLQKLSGSVTEPPKAAKREFTEPQRAEAADSGAALPDGSFPIKNKSDLDNAITAHGRAKNKARAKRHIKRRAAALGLTDHLPEDWKKKIAKGGTVAFYTVSNLLSLLGSLECAEERMEDEGRDDCYWMGEGATRIEASKELTDRFGSLLVQFGDIIAELLDELLEAMGEEERGEALEAMAKVFGGGDAVFSALEAMAKRNAAPPRTENGDAISNLKELLNVD